MDTNVEERPQKPQEIPGDSSEHEESSVNNDSEEAEKSKMKVSQFETIDTTSLTSEGFEMANGSNTDEESWETVSDEEIESHGVEQEHKDRLCGCKQCANALMVQSATLEMRVAVREQHTVAVLPSTVTKLEMENGSTVYLVGTAHFSETSQDEVSQTIQEVCPDVVMVELCQSRVGILQYDEETLLREAKDISLKKLKFAVKESGVVGGVMQLLLLSMSAHLTKQLGMAPGGEFRRAVQEAKKIPGCRIVLGDRPIQITLSRAMASLSVWQKLKLAWYLLTSRDPISKEDVEKYKQKDMLAEMLAEMTGDFPRLTEVFVSERDRYMAHTLQNAAIAQPMLDNRGEFVQTLPSVVVGIVGMGHANGIVENIRANIDVDELLRIPEPSASNRTFKVALRAALVAALSWGIYRIIKLTGVI